MAKKIFATYELTGVMYRIYSTTDGQNLGMYIEQPSVGDILVLRNGYEMLVCVVTISGNYMTVSNPNYIIKAKRSG